MKQCRVADCASEKLPRVNRKNGYVAELIAESYDMDLWREERDRDDLSLSSDGGIRMARQVRTGIAVTALAHAS